MRYELMAVAEVYGIPVAERKRLGPTGIDVLFCPLACIAEIQKAADIFNGIIGKYILPHSPVKILLEVIAHTEMEKLACAAVDELQGYRYPGA